jgi:hypothetical protein
MASWTQGKIIFSNPGKREKIFSPPKSIRENRAVPAILSVSRIFHSIPLVGASFIWLHISFAAKRYRTE